MFWQREYSSFMEEHPAWQPEDALLQLTENRNASIVVAHIDIISHQKIQMTVHKNLSSYCMARHVGKKGVHPANLASYAVEKSATVPKTKINFLRCKQKSHISTFNTRTHTIQWPTDRWTCCCSRKLQPKISSVSKNTISSMKMFYWNIIWCRKRIDTHHLISYKKQHQWIEVEIGWYTDKPKKPLINIESITPHIIVTSFNGNPHQTTIVCCYSPTNIAEEDEVEHFYNDLSSLIRQIPHHNVTMTGRDGNAKLGKNDRYKHSFHENTNRNGMIL